MCTVADSKKKKEFFIQPVNKIIRILSHLSSFSVSLSVTLSSPQSLFLLNIFPITLSSLSLKQTSLPPPIASRRLTPHAADRLLIEAAGLKLIEARRSPHATGRLISRRRSLAHQAAGLKPMELADVLLVCDL